MQSNKKLQISSEKGLGKGLVAPLIVIATAQLMLVLDDSISNIALPSIQSDLGLSAANLPWVINSYILAFGGLILFGGRMGDLFGRRRILQIGIALFTIASLLSGLAMNGVFLVVARSLQGIGAALAAPNALAIIPTTFPEGKPRNTALAMYGAMSGLGITIGLLLGGILTETLGWRWVYFITVPIGLGVLAGSRKLVDAEKHKGTLDTFGAITGTAGMGSLVYAITRSGEHGWTDVSTVSFYISAVVFLLLFVIRQARSKNPLLPLGLFNDRNRSGSYLGMLILAFGPMGTLYLITLYMQIVLQYPPFKTGAAWLPFSVGIVVSSVISTKLVTRFAPRVLIAMGMLTVSAGVFWLSTIGPTVSYFGHLLPAIFATAFGFGLSFVPMTLTAVNNIETQEAGIASALFNSSQQIGTALGLSVLSSIAVKVTESKIPNTVSVLEHARNSGNDSLVETTVNALVEGYASGLRSSAIILAIAALITALLVNARRPTR